MSPHDPEGPRTDENGEARALPLILVVDDQPANIQILYEILREDYEVCMATSGPRALEFCATRLPDLILLDVVMPEMDGYEVCRRLKSDARTQAIPVVFVTARRDPTEEALALDRGGADFIPKPVHAQVVRARVRTQLSLKSMAEQLRSLALIDALTGIANRRKFDETLAAEWRACARSASPLSVIIFDIDYFKRFNDTYGHGAGDSCIHAVASTLCRMAQRPRDLVARYGGEEFAAILPETPLEDARQKAVELEAAIRRLGIAHRASDAAGVVTISAGVATVVPDDSSVPGDLIATADRMLYTAKEAGRARVCSAAVVPGRGAEDLHASTARAEEGSRRVALPTRVDNLRPVILVVDDMPSNIQVLAEALSSQYEVVVATSGQAALDIAGSARQPSLILLDVMMPELDGYEVCRRLKANVRTRHIVVIFVTARTDPASEEHGFELGAVDYITKPFNIAVVRARVRTHLTIQGLQDELEALNARLNRRLSELMSAHAELRSSRELQELYARAFESTADGVLIADADGIIVAVNPSFTRITGYPAAEAIGKNPRILKSGRHPPAFYTELWAALRERGHWSGEILNRRKDGAIYPELRTISTVRDAHGRLTHYVAVFSDISAVKQVQERLDFLTWHDPLTGLANRHLFTDRLQSALDICSRSGTQAAALFIGIDRFHRINEARGPAVADRVLARLAERLKKILRDGDTLARLSADHFAVALPELGASREIAARRALDVAEQLRGAIAAPVEVDGTLLHLTASAGISLLPDGPAHDAMEYLRRAEAARHRSVDDGGNRSLFFEEEIGSKVRRRFNLEQDLHGALKGGELLLYAQPQVDDVGQPTGMEMLLRWKRPDQGFVGPAEFIPIAEETDLILKIEAWTLAQACGVLHELQSKGSSQHISLNISPRHFRQPGFAHEVAAALSERGAKGEGLVLELTENIIINDVADAVAKMTSLADLGVRFSIDDFGVGYSSLGYLQRLPLHELKLDYSFMRRAPFDAGDAAIVDVIVAIARQLRLHVIAEGVELAEHVAFLDRRKPIGRQGFYYGRPIPSAAWLARLLGRS